MSTLDLQIYELLKSRFGEKEATLFIEYIEQKTEKKIEEKQVLFNSLLKQDLEKLKLELINEISISKVDMIKWFFAFFITLVLLIVGLYFK